jgi:LuxR family maltose regulon positive regulatory protein
MAMSLLATKLYIPPVRPELVPRPRLVERLNVGTTRKLTLISAPAGFGKTTLLSEWIHGNAERRVMRNEESAVSPVRRSSFLVHPSNVAWLSLDEGDNDPIRFWCYVVAALQTVDGSLGTIAQAALESAQPPVLEALVTALINDIVTASIPLVIVLDDYHVIAVEEIHKSLDFLLDHLPLRVHLVITSRADPPLSLSRRRARAQLVEIRASDLRFTAQEAAEFLNRCMGLDLLAEDIAALESRTEGWIVGLQMAALSLQERTDKHGFVSAFAGDDRYVGDYLIEEVLQRQPSHVRTFLLQTAILERLCGSLCDAVTGRDDSGTILKGLEKANLFIVPLDNRRHWYRYHRLFADLLRQRLRESPPPLPPASEGEKGGIEALHLRASQWYEREGFIAEAMSHLLAVPDYGRAATLVERHWLAALSRSETVLIHDWLEALPEELIRSRPILCVALAWSSALAPPHSLALAERWLQDAARAMTQAVYADAPDEADRTIHDLVTRHTTALRASLARARGVEPQTVIDLSLQALDLVPEGDLMLRGGLILNLAASYLALGDEDDALRAFAEGRRIGEAGAGSYITLAGIFGQADVALRRGQLHEATAIYREALRSIAKPAERESRPIPVAGGIYISLGSVLLEQNDVEQAEQALAKGLELIKLTGESGFDVAGYTALARLRQAQGDGAGALDLLDQAEQLGLGFDAHIAAHRVRLWLAQAKSDPGRLADAVRWARGCGITLDAREGKNGITLSGDWHDFEQLTLVRVLIAQHQAPPHLLPVPSDYGQPSLQSLLRFLERQLRHADERGWIERVIELSILQALILQILGDTSQAIHSLEHALILAEPESYVRIFVDEGAPMAQLLYQAAERDISSGYTGRLLAAFDLEGSRSATAPASDLKPETLIEPLSKREIEVLQLIAEGLTNREIAQKLVISPGTVKVHTNNIYGKLSVRNRTQAVVKARTLGILPSS